MILSLIHVEILVDRLENYRNSMQCYISTGVMKINNYSAKFKLKQNTGALLLYLVSSYFFSPSTFVAKIICQK